MIYLITSKMKKNYSLYLCLFLIGLNAVGLFLVYRESSRLVGLQGRYSSQLQLESQNLSPILEAFPDEQKVIQFISAINLARPLLENLSLNFKSDVPLTDKKQPYLPFVLLASGQTGELSGFVSQLLNSPYVLEITGLEAKSKDNFIETVELVINANLYVAENF